MSTPVNPIDPDCDPGDLDDESRRKLMGAMIGVRKYAKLSQREVGERMGGISAASVSQIEHQTDWHITTLFRYARAVGVRIELQCYVPEFYQYEDFHLADSADTQEAS